MDRKPRIRIVFTRHFAKTAISKIEGSEEDVRIPLSEEGISDALASGPKILANNFDRARIIDSGYVRTRQTNAVLFKGAGIDIYSPTIPLEVLSNSFLGFPQSDGLVEMPDWRKLGEYAAVLFQLKNNYLSRMAGYAAAGLGEIVHGVKSEIDELVDTETEQIFKIKTTSEPPRIKRLLDERKKPTSLIHIATHCQPMEAVAYVLRGLLEADESGNHTLHEYIGNFNKGESFVGVIYELGADPIVHFDIKGSSISHRLSAIERMANLHFANALRYQSTNPGLIYNQADLVAVR